ncbi:VOC family protein [Aeromonas popoffii]
MGLLVPGCHPEPGQDRSLYWHAIIERGGQGCECGWGQDKWGISCRMP